MSSGSSAAHLLVGDGDEPLLGQFPQRAHVRPHVQLAANQNHLGVGAELLRLTLPLHKQGGSDRVSQKKDALTLMTLLLKVLNTVADKGQAQSNSVSRRKQLQTRLKKRSVVQTD